MGGRDRPEPPEILTDPAARRIVVIGAGFGGLWAVRRFVSHRIGVTLIDRNNYHTFFPLLYQVAAAELGPSEIAYPVRSLFRRHALVDFRRANVHNIDLDARIVEAGESRLEYDFLVMAPGSVPNFFAVEGAARHAFPLRTMDDAIPLRYHVLNCFERAAQTSDPSTRKSLLRFVIAGGGPTGVEYAGALAELIYGPLLKDFGSIERDEVDIRLLEGGGALLAGMPARLQEYARVRLERRGVQVLTGSRVVEVASDSVVTRDAGDGKRRNRGETNDLGDATNEHTSRTATHTVVWAAGVQGDPAVASWGLPLGPGGRVPVGGTLQVPGYPEAFVVGDLAYLEVRGEALPQIAQVALQQGSTAAENVVRMIGGQEPADFTYKDLGMLAVIGRNAAVAHLWGRSFTGFAAWTLWLVVHVVNLMGFRNRVLVLVNWAWNYVFYHRAVRLILPDATGEPGAGKPPMSEAP
jgi:NADH dehydrogenase